MKLLYFIVLLAGTIATAQKDAKAIEARLDSLEFGRYSYQSPVISQAHGSSGLTYVSAGNMVGYLSDFEVYFRNRLRQSYGIGHMAYGCLLSGPELNLMKKSNAEIDEKYGVDFINNERKSAREKFEKRKGS